MQKQKYLTHEIIEELPNLSIELSFTDGQFKGLKYKGFLIVCSSELREFKYYCGRWENFLPQEDEEKIRNFNPDNEKVIFQNYYKLVFMDYIYIFQYERYMNGFLMIGNLLEKSPETRLNLIELEQKFLMEQLQLCQIFPKKQLEDLRVTAGNMIYY